MDCERILIANGDTNLRKVLDAQLTRSGYSVTLIDDDESAVAAGAGPEYQVVILDLDAPGSQGIEVLRAIRRSGRDVPVIAMTSDDCHDTISRLVAYGATACICKPFDLSALVALVRSALAEKVGPGLPRPVLTALSTPGTMVHLTVYDGPLAGWYSTAIDRCDGSRLVLSCPSCGSAYVVLRPGTMVSVGLAGPDAFYSFETAVLPSRGSSSALVVRTPHTIHRMQRRRHERYPSDALLEISVNEDGRPLRVEARARDIAEGGVRAVSQSRLRSGIEAQITSTDPVTGVRTVERGVVVRVQPLADASGWEYGIRFDDPIEAGSDRK